MKKKILTMTAIALMMGYTTSANALFNGSIHFSAIDHTADWCSPNPAKKDMDNSGPMMIWFDEAMWVATGLDIVATNMQKGKTVDAKKAIKQLKKALGEEEGGSGSGGGDQSAAEPEVATVFAPELVLTQLSITKKDGATVFNNTRQAIEDFLFESASNLDCTGSSRDCAVIRQNQWLLASVTMASATADKVLSLTANQERVKNVSRKGSSSLVKHFQQLAKDFNAQTTPTGMYNIMAEIVLDTHRQVNEANVLLARDLEMQGLKAVRETAVTGYDRSSGTEE